MQGALPESGRVRFGTRPATVAVERSITIAGRLLAQFETLEILVQIIVDAVEELVEIDEANVALISEFEFSEVQVLPDIAINVLEILEVYLGVLHEEVEEVRMLAYGQHGLDKQMV